MLDVFLFFFLFFGQVASEVLLLLEYLSVLPQIPVCWDMHYLIYLFYFVLFYFILFYFLSF